MESDKKEKHSVMKVECAYCGTSMGTKEGHGETGTTHGICPDCAEIEYLLLARDLVKREKLSWEEAKKRVRAMREKKP